MHNDNRTIAHIVTGLDGIEITLTNGRVENDGWRFVPNGNNDYINENITFAPAVTGTDIIWQDDNGNIIGNGSEITVTPTETAVYTAGASLCGSAGDWCGFEGGIEGDKELLIEFVPTEITTNFQIHYATENLVQQKFHFLQQETGIILCNKIITQFNKE